MQVDLAHVAFCFLKTSESAWVQNLISRMDSQTTVPGPDFDLKRVALFFRRSLTKDGETTEKKVVKEATATPGSLDQADGAVINHVQVDNKIDSTRTAEADDVLLDDYVEAYNELNRMFPKLGRLFSFIAADVGDKTHILAAHRTSPVAEKYERIGGMLDYEKNEAKILDPHGHHHHLSLHHHHELANGSRTLLRLHRALLFVVHFIEGIHRAKESDKMSHLARKAYDETLALHHPWYVRTGVHVAVHTLPNRQQLLADLAGADVAEEEAERVMDETAQASRSVYNVVQKLYEKHQLLDLP